MTSSGDDHHAGVSPVSPALVEAIAGLTAGSVATLVVHPLDIVKTRMQIYRGSGTAPTTVTVLRGLLTSSRPLAALYRGLTPNLLGNGASWASFFFFKARMERLLASARGSPAAGLSPADYFVASGLAGACVQVLTNPLWVLKTRMLSSDRGAAGAYPSMWTGAARLLREEGPRGFYRGLGVSLLGVSHGAVQFAVYEPLKRAWAGRAGRTDGQPGSGRPSNQATLLLSTTAKLVAGAVTYPYQVVRSRMQNYDAEAQFGRGITGVSRQLWHEGGLRGFYQGLVPSVVRVLPATWATFLVYENMRHYVPRWFA